MLIEEQNGNFAKPVLCAFFSGAMIFIGLFSDNENEQPAEPNKPDTLLEEMEELINKHKKQNQ